MNAYRLLVRKPRGKRRIGRPRCRWMDNIKIDLGKIVWGGGVDWIRLAQDRNRLRALVNAERSFFYFGGGGGGLHPVALVTRSLI
jgi:hypothetical protein